MKIKRNRVVSNVKGCGVKSYVKSVRAEKEFWDKCDKVCKIEKTTRNELILRVISKYCDKRLSKALDKQNRL